MKTIPLTQGKFAVVDDDDYEFLMQWKWHAYTNYRIWYARRQTLKADSPAGKQHPILMHRVINKTPAGMHTDHVNGDGLDNRKANLRTATSVENGRNRGSNRGATSLHKGVDWDSRHQKWRAQAMINRRKIFLGRFVNEVDAAKAYGAFAAANFAEFNQTDAGASS